MTVYDPQTHKTLVAADGEVNRKFYSINKLVMDMEAAGMISVTESVSEPVDTEIIWLDISSPETSTGVVKVYSGGAWTAMTPALFSIYLIGSDALVAALEAALEAEIDALPVLASIQGKAVTLGGALTTAADLTTAGANALTLTTTGATNVTLPTTGTLATLAGSETLTNKSLTSPAITGNADASGATTLKLPVSAAPTISANGHIAVDTTVTDFSHGLLRFYGGEDQFVISVPVAALAAPTDGHVLTYDATADEFKLAAGGGGGGGANTALSNLASVAINTTLVSDTDNTDDLGTSSVSWRTGYFGTGIELGHASDTTLTRSSAGNMAIEGNVVYRAGGTDVALADGGTGASLTDPNADRIMFWDDSAGQVTWLTASTGLSISGTSLSVSSLYYTQLASGTVSAAATLDIVLSGYTGYRALVFVLQLLPATDGVNLLCRFSTDGGSTYDASGYNWSAASYTDAGAASITGSGSDTSITISGANIGSATTEGYTGTATLVSQTSTSLWSRINAVGYCINSSATPAGAIQFGGGAREAAQDTDAIRFLFSSGNIADGTWAVYGIP